MIGDRSRGQEATWEFLDRRISDVVQTGSSINFVSLNLPQKPLFRLETF
jgi:hypothetical protein